MYRLRLPQTTYLTLGCMSCLVGLAAARRVDFSSIPLALLTGLFAAGYYSKHRTVSFVFWVVTGILLGLARGHTFTTYTDEYQALLKQPVVLHATAETDAIYSSNGQLSLDVNQVFLPHQQQRLIGKIKIEGSGAPMVYRGDRVQVSGSLRATKGSAQARISFAKLQVIRRGSSRLDRIRRSFIAGLLSVVPEPEASFGAGLLLGQRSTIPKDINDQLSVTGLTHLVAVSGYNLTIIIMAVRKMLGKASKFQSTTAAALLIVVFVLLTGLSASIVRAAIVSGLSLFAWYYGRQFKPLLLIMLTAVITTFWNPFYLWSDIGWYLSFLAFFGVLQVAPVVSKFISRGRQPKLIGSLLSETISAQLMTLPIIMFIFGRVSNISLVANVMVVPLVPLAMLLTLVSGIVGMTTASLGGWLAWPAKLLLTYMLDVTGIFSQVPHAAFEQKIDLITMLFAYAVIVIFVWIGNQINVRKNT